MSDLLIPEKLDLDAATIVRVEQRWEDNELLDTQEMADLFEACHRLRAHIAAQEAVIAGLREQIAAGFDAIEASSRAPRAGTKAWRTYWEKRAALALPNGHPTPAARERGGRGMARIWYLDYHEDEVTLVVDDQRRRVTEDEIGAIRSKIASLSRTFRNLDDYIRERDAYFASLVAPLVGGAAGEGAQEETKA